MLTDSHAHLTHEGTTLQAIGEILDRARAAGVSRIINIATCPDELVAGLQLKERYDWIDNVGGTTPHDVLSFGEAHFNQFATWAREGKLIAVGETGLDYHYTHSPKELQQQFLRRYLELATECHLPVVIHCREAFADLFQMLDSHFQGKGVLHCFTGTIDEAQEVIDRGWYLSLSGIVTFKKSIELQKVAQLVPLDQLLIETDAPFLAPQPMRGKPNEPAYLVHTARMIAELRGISFEELAQATTRNGAKLFSS